MITEAYQGAVRVLSLEHKRTVVERKQNVYN